MLKYSLIFSLALVGCSEDIKPTNEAVASCFGDLDQRAISAGATEVKYAYDVNQNDQIEYETTHVNKEGERRGFLSLADCKTSQEFIILTFGSGDLNEPENMSRFNRVKQKLFEENFNFGFENAQASESMAEQKGLYGTFQSFKERSVKESTQKCLCNATYPELTQ